MFCQPTDPTDSHGLRRDPAAARHPDAARPVRERGRRDRLLLRVDQEPVAHPLRPAGPPPGRGARRAHRERPGADDRPFCGCGLARRAGDRRRRVGTGSVPRWPHTHIGFGRIVDWHAFASAASLRFCSRRLSVQSRMFAWSFGLLSITTRSPALRMSHSLITAHPYRFFFFRSRATVIPRFQQTASNCSAAKISWGAPLLPSA